ncbi:hypothetical protein DFH06DRAFT_1420717 [Mycena polygramma]|nr:hypothetical protein DFH06DRAFT_1420717 [Mycena polygramma]
MELLPRCTLFTLVAFAHVNPYTRLMIQAFCASNLKRLLRIFLGFDTKVMEAFDACLELSLSGIGGSVVAAVLTFPYKHGWTPTNLNLVVPRGRPTFWHQFFAVQGLPAFPVQDGVDRRFRHTTLSNWSYCSRSPGRAIMISESCNDSILTPVAGATNTFAANLATCSDIYCNYPSLTNQNRALEGWHATDVHAADRLHRREIRHSFSTGGWMRPCGLACPLYVREIRGLKGVGILRYGGIGAKHKGESSTIGIPNTDNDITWQLGDSCPNPECDSRKGGRVRPRRLRRF